MFSLILIIYLSFISLGLPDSLLGSGWPSMHSDFHSTLSAAGTVSMIISIGTVISSLNAVRLIQRFSTAKVTLYSVLMTALALWGFSFCREFWQLCLMAVPYGLGAGAIDSALNNYVALHLKARHMSWLHCMWGIGASIGPYVMGFCLTHRLGWQMGYRTIGTIQALLALILLFTLSLWKKDAKADEKQKNVLSLREALRIPGVLQIVICFFAYCALESSASLWASSWMHGYKGVPAEEAASYAGLFYLGMTSGRAVSGFFSEKAGDSRMIRFGCMIICLGLAMILFGKGIFLFAGLFVIGLGCAPVYPSVIHSTPARFGRENSQSLVGIQMASAYVGTTLTPKLFGALSDLFGISVYPYFLFVLLLLTVIMHERTEHKTKETAVR